ncbi:hypothetical protein BDW02DRAFT_333236 [Decorospora gaudefroyi]|uniref:Uncharacterized protein n=1 Tax=Decorospora gaudefroyi TaxID=184978 RepID=A0A6A5KGH1_9PLEO|nr:hypothetical protein BDW02DRAFT_333236 [Decorospora gaudefroyi]
MSHRRLDQDASDPFKRRVPAHSYAQCSCLRGAESSMVDRTIDLASAAEQLVTACFAFCGTSPYTLDLVSVNEVMKKEFLEHVMRRSIRFLTGSTGIANVSTQINVGTVKKPNKLMSMPKMPNGFAGPCSVTHSPTKKVQANNIMPLRKVMATKQKPPVAAL